MQYRELIGYKSPAGVKSLLGSVAYYPFHLHCDDIEILCVLNGRVRVSDSAADYPLSYGDVYVFNPNDPHKIVSEDEDNILLTLYISRERYAPFFPGLKDAYFICDTFLERDIYAADVKYLRFQLARLHRQYAGECRDLLLEQYARELLELLLNQFQRYVYRQDAGGKAAIARLQIPEELYRNYERMYRVVDRVSDHFAEKLSLTQIAKDEYLSPSHLSKYIRSTLGLSYSQLVSLTRCEEASRLLADTGQTVDQIAAATGFANRKHLSTQFQRWYGQTPSQYRGTILRDLRDTAKIRLQPFDYEFSQVILDMYLDGY